MSDMTIEKFLETYPDTCVEARVWLKASKLQTMQQAWEFCPDASWMFWALRRMDAVPASTLTRVLLHIIRELLWEHLRDERLRRAIETAESCLAGHGERYELKEALRDVWSIYWISRKNSAAKMVAWTLAAVESGEGREASVAIAEAMQMVTREGQIKQAGLVRREIANPFAHQLVGEIP